MATLTEIVSGGQTGADRAALDWAIGRGIPHGGWCPAGRIAEDGVLDAIYQLTETDSPGYRRRTLWNVRDSDATLILNLGALDGGSLETLRAAERLGRPCLVAQLDNGIDALSVQRITDWLRSIPVRRLNVAGPRESKRPGIYGAALALLESLA